MSSPELVLIFVTAPSRDVATAIAEMLIGERLAACVALLPEIESFYRWEGKVERNRETQLLIKAPSSRIPELEARIHALHPYDTPEFIAVPAHFVSARYLKWALNESDGQ